MAIETYKYDYDFGEAYVWFEVDTEKFTEENAQETLDFFLWNYDKKNDPINEVLKKYALEAIYLATINQHNTKGVIQDFNNHEGYCKVNGSSGIKLKMVNAYVFEDEKLEKL